jgi:hypothetical protein
MSHGVFASTRRAAKSSSGMIEFPAPLFRMPHVICGSEHLCFIDTRTVYYQSEFPWNDGSVLCVRVQTITE